MIKNLFVKKNKHQPLGFTLIEILLLIIVTGILANTILLGVTTALLKSPAILKNNIALQTARQCMEWLIGQKRLNGYNSISCPSTSVPSFCTAPANYTVAINITCTTINSDANYKTFTVTVSGDGNATLSMLVGNDGS